MYVLKDPKPRWETGQRDYSNGQLRPICVRVDGQGVELSLKGERHAVRLSWSAIYHIAIRAEAEAEKERKAR